MHAWFFATRPWSLTASAIPVSMGAALALSMGVFHPWLFALTLLGGVLLQVGTNLLNTYGDFMSGVDTEDSARTCPQLVTGLFKPEHMRLAGLAALACATLVGLVLVANSGWLLLVFGLVGVAGAYGYTTGVMPYKYLGLGPLMVFWLMGPLMTMPAFYVQTGEALWSALWIGLPVGFLVTAILHANELRDIEHDRAAGIHTMSMYMGLRSGLALYLAMVGGAFVSLTVLVVLGLIPAGAILGLVLAPVYLRSMGPLWRFVIAPEKLSGDQVDAVLEQVRLLEGFSAENHFKFGLLMLVGILLETGVRALWA